MDDDKSRSYRDRDPVAREAPEQFSRGALRDLLVELARLTGQGDPNVSRDGGSSGLDWAADDAAPEQHQLGKKHHVPEPSARSSRLRPAEMIGGQFLPQAPTLLLTASDDRHEGDIQPARGPSRRNGLVMAIAVLGLVVLGAVGAFANRAVFGGPGLASPPKAENEPNKLDPNSQPSNLSQASIASAGSDKNSPHAGQPTIRSSRQRHRSLPTRALSDQRRGRPDCDRAGRSSARNCHSGAYRGICAADARSPYHLPGSLRRSTRSPCAPTD